MGLVHQGVPWGEEASKPSLFKQPDTGTHVDPPARALALHSRSEGSQDLQGRSPLSLHRPPVCSQ